MRNLPRPRTAKVVFKVTLIDGFILFILQVILLQNLLTRSGSKGELSAKVIFNVSKRMAWRWTVIAEGPGGLFADCPWHSLCPDAE